MSKNKVSEGDIFYISNYSFEGRDFLLDKNRLGKIIFISKVTKKMIGFVASKGIYEKKPLDVSNIEFDTQILYTGDQFIKIGAWEIIGHQEVTLQEKDLTKRIVGSGLWRLDEYLGVASQEDRKKYKKQLIQGLGLIYTILNKEF